MTNHSGIARVPTAPIQAQVAAKLFPQPTAAPRQVQTRAKAAKSAKPTPTPITIGQAFRVCFVLLIGFTFAPLPHLDDVGPAPAAVRAG